jgi:hypothetical protein
VSSSTAEFFFRSQKPKMSLGDFLHFHLSPSESVLQPFSGTDEESFVLEFCPGSNIMTYIERLERYVPKCSLSVYVTAVFLLQRYLLLTKQILHRANIHYAFTVAFLVAMKTLEDEPYPNRHIAAIAGLSVTMLNRFEVSFLFAIQFDVKIEPELFEKQMEAEARRMGVEMKTE